MYTFTDNKQSLFVGFKPYSVLLLHIYLLGTESVATRPIRHSVDFVGKEISTMLDFNFSLIASTVSGIVVQISGHFLSNVFRVISHNPARVFRTTYGTFFWAFVMQRSAEAEPTVFQSGGIARD